MSSTATSTQARHSPASASFSASEVRRLLKPDRVSQTEFLQDLPELDSKMSALTMLTVTEKSTSFGCKVVLMLCKTPRQGEPYLLAPTLDTSAVIGDGCSAVMLAESASRAGCGRTLGQRSRATGEASNMSSGRVVPAKASHSVGRRPASWPSQPAASAPRAELPKTTWSWAACTLAWRLSGTRVWR